MGGMTLLLDWHWQTSWEIVDLTTNFFTVLRRHDISEVNLIH